MTPGTSTRVAVVGGARTPFAKAGTTFRKHSPLQLSVHSGAQASAMILERNV